MSYSVTEKDVRDYLLPARLTESVNKRTDSLYRIVRKLAGAASVYRVLADTPDQVSDVFRVLVDDKLVVDFELSREDNAPPFDINIYTVEEYRKMVQGGFDAVELKVALDLFYEETRR